MQGRPSTGHAEGDQTASAIDFLDMLHLPEFVAAVSPSLFIHHHCSYNIDCYHLTYRALYRLSLDLFTE